MIGEPTISTERRATAPVSRSCPEAGSIVVRSGAYPSEKCPTHGVGIAETAPGSHALQRNSGILQQSARGIETRGFDIVGGGNAGLALKNAGEISHTHRRAISKRRN